MKWLRKDDSVKKQDQKMIKWIFKTKEIQELWSILIYFCIFSKFALYFLVFVYTVEADIISCRSLSITNWNEVGEQKTCDLSISTTIVVDNMSFEGEADTTIGALDLRTNGPITFLPIDIDKKFPALVLYESCCGSIKTIAKKNFKSLISLRWLNLGDNQIDRIPSDTFEDMKALEWIELRKKCLMLCTAFLIWIFSFRSQQNKVS